MVPKLRLEAWVACGAEKPKPVPGCVVAGLPKVEPKLRPAAAPDAGWAGPRPGAGLEVWPKPKPEAVVAAACGAAVVVAKLPKPPAGVAAPKLGACAVVAAG